MANPRHTQAMHTHTRKQCTHTHTHTHTKHAAQPATLTFANRWDA